MVASAYRPVNTEVKNKAISESLDSEYMLCLILQLSPMTADFIYHTIFSALNLEQPLKPIMVEK